MSLFYHRNPYKSYSKINFDSYHIPADVESRSICDDVSVRRGKLLEMIKEPTSSVSGISEALQQYISYFYGFIVSPTDNAKYNSKIRCYAPVKWTESIAENLDDVQMQHDFLFEFASMLLNVAFWFAKHAAYLASKELMGEEGAKECHRSLRTAMGLINLIKDDILSYLNEKPKEMTDLHSDILMAYYNQFCGEAQELTTIQAIQKEHNASLISALAYETARFYKAAELSLKPCNEKVVAKWKKYLEFKNYSYMAYANGYYSKKLLDEEKGGEAIASANDAIKYFKKAKECEKQYKKASGISNSREIAETKYWTSLGATVDRFLDTATRENNMIYHNKVPATVPELELKATMGLVNPIMPEIKMEHCPNWGRAYNGFSDEKLTKYIIDKQDKELSKEDLKKEKNMKVEVITEKPIYSTDSKGFLSGLF